jgi:thiamine pyrophosphokinase
MTKKILVVANGEAPSPLLLESLVMAHSGLVAVDGGLYTCLKYGYEPELLIGDFDSVSEACRKKYSTIQQVYTPDQNKSDLEKALAYLFDSGATEITVSAALGKRLDHTLTNICLLTRYPDRVKFETDREVCFALSSPSVLTCHVGQMLSLIPISTSVSSIFTTGLKWELKGQDLNKNYVSLSNVCLTNSISISFTSGDLVACLRRSIHDEQEINHSVAGP